MAEDTQDQGTPSALRPRPGWRKAANNPEAIHATVNLDAVTSTGYMDSSYDPPKLTLHYDAGEFDQSPFKEAQQGHRLARASSPTSNRGGGAGVSGGGSVRGAASDGPAAELEGAPRADGRPAWDSRFFLERTAWEAQPRTMLLRPPSTNAFPGSSIRRSLPVNSGCIGCGDVGDSTTNPGGRRVSVPDSLDGDPTGSRTGDNTIIDGNGTRTTILPGLYVAAPPIWASPYGEQSSAGPSRNPTSPGSSISPGPGAGTLNAGSAPPRPPRANLMDSYIGRAYSPDQSYFRASGVGTEVEWCGGDSPGDQTRQGVASETDEGGVDGHGTHLPALERAGYGKAAASNQGIKEKEAQAAAAAKSNAQKAAIMALGAVYLPAGAKLRHDGGLEPRSNRLVVAPPPLYTRSCRSTDGDGGRYAHSLDAGGQRVGADRCRDMSPGGGGIWRPSGRQPIPDTAPPVPKSTRQSSSGEAKETQEEADRRRAVPRDQAIYSPERYPIVGMGWFMPPEKFPPNPAYAGVKAKYLEARPPRSDDEAVRTPHMPDIHSKPWLTPGKHLVTDSSAPPPKMTGTAGARPPYSFSPSATGTSVATGTLRSNKGTARSGRSGARGGGKGNGRKKLGSNSSSRNSGSGRESGSESGGEVDGDREVLAVIGGVRLMSIIRRNDMEDEARLEAEEDAQMAEEDAADARRRDHPGQGEEGTDQELVERRYSGQDTSSARTGTSPSNKGGAEGDQDSRRLVNARRSGSSEQGDKAPTAPKTDDSCRGNGAVECGTPRSGRDSSNEGATVREGTRREEAEAEDADTKEAKDVSRQEDGNQPEADLYGGDDEEPRYAGDDDEDDEDNDSVAAAAALAGLGCGDEDGADGDGEVGDAAGDSEDGE
ncbi:hypothetical protein VaNZ11_016770 [Volvox africanus]|uniref:Uncharacterized protein n=1 Tax=Volvox africanus TaxID=51714 RepID=A0ABQ5SNF7_9CHLO|nr:hypothetical protein VaNZ11_016770 [Volvox africanus]